MPGKLDRRSADQRLLAAGIALLAIVAGGSVATYLACPGCIPAGRVNKACEWQGDARLPLESSNATHRRHLVEDAHLAEELAISYADAEFKRRFGFEAHGGLIEGGRFRAECLSRMFAAIEDNHDVTAQQIEVARGERSRTFDAAAVLLFVPFYALAAAAACRWLWRRFSESERFARLVAAALASAALSFLGVQCLRLWGGVWEVIRVGNGHMSSMRAASYTRWPQQYPGADFIGGILLFWLVALLCSRFLAETEPAPDLRSATLAGLTGRHLSGSGD